MPSTSQRLARHRQPTSRAFNPRGEMIDIYGPREPYVEPRYGHLSDDGGFYLPAKWPSPP